MRKNGKESSQTDVADEDDGAWMSNWTDHDGGDHDCSEYFPDDGIREVDQNDKRYFADNETNAQNLLWSVYNMIPIEDISSLSVHQVSSSLSSSGISVEAWANDALRRLYFLQSIPETVISSEPDESDNEDIVEHGIRLFESPILSFFDNLFRQTIPSTLRNNALEALLPWVQRSLHLS